MIGAWATLLLLILFGTTNSAQAQIELDVSGNIGIGTASPNATYRLRVSGDNAYAIRATGNNYGVYGAAVNSNTSMYGIYGYSRAHSGGGVTYGVYGRAQTYDSIAYGVYGFGTSTYGGGSWYAGYFNGKLAYTGGLWSVSDRMLKTDIRLLSDDSILERIGRLKPSSFVHPDNAYSIRLGLETGIRRYGFIAQDVEEVFPNLVEEQRHALPVNSSEDKDSTTNELESADFVTYKAVNYIDMIPLLVQAIQELKAEVDQLKAESRR